MNNLFDNLPYCPSNLTIKNHYADIEKKDIESYFKR